MEKGNNCLNCGNTSEENYCSNCGQDVDTHPIDWHYLLHDLQHFLHLDNSFFYTVKQLFIRPGEAIRDYMDGKRVGYFGPLSTVLTISGIYILIYYLGNIAPLNILSQMVIILNEVMYNDELFFPDWLVDNYAFIELLVFIPVFSVASYFAFYKFKFSFFEHIAINAFLSAQRMLIGVLTFPVLILFNEGIYSNTIEILVSLIEVGFTIWACMTLFKKENKIHLFGLTLSMLLIVFFQLFILTFFSRFL
jgi:hypothetical protein